MNQSPMLRFMATLGDRLAVGRRALDPLAGVRILLPQPQDYTFLLSATHQHQRLK